MRRSKEMKSHYWLSAYPAQYPAQSLRRGFRKILEAKDGSLRLYDPTRRDSLLRVLVGLIAFLGFLAGYGLLAYLLLRVLLLFQSFDQINGISALTGLILLLGFFATLYFSGGLSDDLATFLELRLAARHRERVSTVHVVKIKPTQSGWIQLLELVNDGTHSWFNVQVSGPDLQAALKLAGEKIIVDLDR